MVATRAEILLLHAARRPPDGSPPSWHHRMRAALPYAKRLEIERRAPGEIAASLDALALLCVGLDRAGDTTVRLSDLLYDEQGAPRLRQGRAISLAHSVSRVACAVADAPATVALGLDLEDLDAAAGGDPARHARLRDWVAIEAVLKAAGQGLRESAAVSLDPPAELADGPVAPAILPGRYAVFRGQRYRVAEPALGLPCLCAVAGHAPLETQIRIETLDLAAPIVSASVERRLGLPA